MDYIPVRRIPGACVIISDAKTATILKRQGVKAGVPDLHLPVARGGYHGLYIELKVGDNTTTKKQKDWIRELNKQGYLAVVCYGWDEAAKQLLDYLETGTAHIAIKVLRAYVADIEKNEREEKANESN